MSTFSPLIKISPESGLYAPAMILNSVDLPAPLSPTMACTSPFANAKFAELRAATPPKCLLTSRASRANGVLAAGSLGAELAAPDGASTAVSIGWSEGSFMREYASNGSRSQRVGGQGTAAQAAAQPGGRSLSPGG